MTGKELYERIEGDYDKMFATLHSDDMIKTFAKMFLNDSSYKELIDAMESEQYEEAFKAAHGLKGVCLNMCYSKIGGIASDITEDLRGGADIEAAKNKLPELKACYEELINVIKEL